MMEFMELESKIIVGLVVFENVRGRDMKFLNFRK